MLLSHIVDRLTKIKQCFANKQGKSIAFLSCSTGSSLSTIYSYKSSWVSMMLCWQYCTSALDTRNCAWHLLAGGSSAETTASQASLCPFMYRN
ncbi:hypothetical protein GDO81_001083 [Engystomops pustulosus]|uniref:Uncharacterized protein n=1 Tax=Engystomops pustulosus TaxID=76066 RepID=A0AAV7DA82_ENGPU|nr:hypothetical protein GDO81_001083 [Engystomops pustulosus]